MPVRPSARSWPQALADDDLYFSPDPRREDLFRARPESQVAVLRERRARLAELSGLPGQWLALRGPGGRRAWRAVQRWRAISCG
jgi:hypothetical protein